MAELESALTSNLGSLTISWRKLGIVFQLGEVTPKIPRRHGTTFCIRETTQNNNDNSCYEHKL